MPSPSEIAWNAPLVGTLHERDRNDQRWETWRAKGARADARTQCQARWVAVGLLGSASLWVAFEIARAGAMWP